MNDKFSSILNRLESLSKYIFHPAKSYKKTASQETVLETTNVEETPFGGSNVEPQVNATTFPTPNLANNMTKKKRSRCSNLKKRLKNPYTICIIIIIALLLIGAIVTVIVVPIIFSSKSSSAAPIIVTSAAPTIVTSAASTIVTVSTKLNVNVSLDNVITITENEQSSNRKRAIVDPAVTFANTTDTVNKKKIKVQIYFVPKKWYSNELDPFFV